MIASILSAPQRGSGARAGGDQSLREAWGQFYDPVDDHAHVRFDGVGVRAVVGDCFVDVGQAVRP